MDIKHNFDFCSFAAANGYSGFRSYFKEIFNPADLSRLYVLKGGPGTGKSSLMKKLITNFKSKGYRTEAILCSSDPDSLDGIIATRGNACIAVIDGTAPHTVDPVYPGAKDEIVNLGDNWDSRFLKAEAKEITELSTAKSRAYKNAYAYLQTAGSAAKIINDSLHERFDFNKAKQLTREILPEKEYGKKARVRLFSCFGKSGLGHLDTPAITEKSYKITGEGKELFLSILADRATALSAERIISPTPLDPKGVDLLILHDKKALYSSFGEGEEINTELLLTGKSDLSEQKARSIHSDALREAQRWFGIAADLHARLESIYTSAMDFEKWDKTYEKLFIEGENILSEAE